MMGVRPRPLPVALALCTALAFAPPAAAYVRSVTSDTPANTLYWASSCETVTIYLNGFSEMTSDEVAKSIGAAAAAWGPDQVTCPSQTSDAGNGHPYFQIIPQLSTGGAVPNVTGKDGKNSVVFVTSDWAGTMLASSDALAVTNVWKDPSGRIVEADIAINADPLMPNPLANLDPGVAPPLHGQARVDLQTLMTHEFGHFLGLAHTCVLDSATGVGSDGNGDEPPGVVSCTGAPSAVVEAVMYPIVEPESITKRVLTADDAAGVCAIYSPSVDPPACTENTPDDGCGCAAAGPGRGAVLAALLAVMALVLPGRLRRRRR